MARAVLPVAVAVAVALVLLMSSVAVRAADALLLLDRAEFVTSDSPEPPPDAAPWQAQALPDDWRLSRPRRLAGAGAEAARHRGHARRTAVAQRC